MALFLGIDVGTSSMKLALWEADAGTTVYTAASPSDTELSIDSPRPGWAEQDPLVWWEHTQKAASLLPPDQLGQVVAIGISYQMHGLVLVDAKGAPVRPSIIWCDGRAAAYGAEAVNDLGKDYCFRNLLNSPANFTASKMRWTLLNEPEAFKKARWALLPGDFVAMKLTGTPATTASGLSEMILWDFRSGALAQPLLDSFGISASLIPEAVATFSVQGKVSSQAAEALGVAAGTPVCYRAGDQPNNAFSLGCLDPGEVAATAGTSGVVYGISDQPVLDQSERFNTFLHVSHTEAAPRYGLLLCVNGCGSLYSWLRTKVFDGRRTYEEMNELAASAPPGSDGLLIYPFGNGAERILGNRDIGASVRGLDFRRHDERHLCRGAQEAIAFALRYGMKSGIEASTIRAGNANLFLSPTFAQTLSTLANAEIEIWDTDGAVGAARGAAVGAGFFRSAREALQGTRVLRRYEPMLRDRDALERAFEHWQDGLGD